MSSSLCKLLAKQAPSLATSPPLKVISDPAPHSPRLNQCRAHEHEEQGWKDEEDSREDQFYRQFCSEFLRAFWVLFVLMESACTLNAWARLVPNLSVWMRRVVKL